MSKAPLSIDATPLPPSWQGKRIDRRELEARQAPSLLSLFRGGDSFANVDDDTIRRLEQHMVPLTFPDGDIVCREDTDAEWTFVLVIGQAEVIRAAPDGTLILVNVLQPGDWGGIMGLVGKAKRLARLSARGELTVQAIDHDSLVKLMDEMPGLSAALLGCMGQRIRDDSAHLSATLQHVHSVGLDEIALHCSPHERLMLDTIRHRVAAAESLSQIMNFVFDSIPHEQDLRMTLTFLEDPGGRLVSHWSRANYEPLLLAANYEEDLDGSLMEESFRTSAPSTVDDLEDFACHHPFNQGAVKRVKEGLGSCMISPLRAGQRTVGFFVRSSRERKAFDEHQLQLHQAIADSIGPVVEKAYRIEMLTKANADYAEVLGFISHELQSPIASMVTDARLLEAGYLGDLNEKQKEKISRSIKKGEYLLRLIRSFLNVAQLEAGSLEASMATDVDLHADVVTPEVELLQSEREERNIGIHVVVEDDLPKVECDAGLLRIAVGNLLRNAITYGREGRDIRVSMGRTNDTNDSVGITVWNEGPGFSEEQQSQLFRRFSRIDDPELKKRKGTGIGLYSTWRIMEMHHGQVTAQSQKGSWAEFKLTLPLRQ